MRIIAILFIAVSLTGCAGEQEPCTDPIAVGSLVRHRASQRPMVVTDNTCRNGYRSEYYRVSYETNLGEIETDYFRAIEIEQ